MTAAGRIKLCRRYFRCITCRVTAYPLDERAGLEGFLSPWATRLAGLAAATWSFDIAASRLEELAGARLDDETLRRHVHRAAAGLVEHRESAPPRTVFEAAQGDVEFLTDGVMAPTRDGWRELKLALFQKRPSGEPAEPNEWAQRDLPAPTVAVAYAAVADRETFASRWGPRAEALGIGAASPLTVLGDGAEWIWNAAEARFPAANQLLDIFHASEHLATAAKALHGEGTVETADWIDRSRQALLADGWPGLCDHVGAILTTEVSATGRAGVDEMLRYFAKHTGRLGYYGRLRTGRSIGSGAVEGLARRMGRRLKVPGRGWRLESIEGMAALVATVDTLEWNSYWTRAAA